MEDSLRFVGWSDPEDLPHWFGQADVALFPIDDTPINRAKCSVKLTELLAAGVPVVADAVGEVPAYLDQGNAGVLVRPGNMQAFSEAVVHLLKDSERSAVLGTTAKRHIAEAYSWEAIARQLDVFYAG
jgi:glycosyltransferase involved in cell wall biosynthesis